MATPKRKQFGNLPPAYGFVLNPYPDERLSRCPFCQGKTGQRKRPLLIHIDPNQLLALNYTCRYCRHCDLLIGHKHEIEHLLTTLFTRLNPTVIGNDYLIIGTVEKQGWRDGLSHPKAVVDMLPHVHDFKTYYQELRMTQPGWYHEEDEPPVREPPASTEWVKASG